LPVQNTVAIVPYRDISVPQRAFSYFLENVRPSIVNPRPE
jgi:hypothetical protein